MKKFMVGMMLLSSFTYAQAEQVSIKNFNFSYKNPNGQGIASSFTRSSLANEEVHVSVDRLDKNFKFIVSGSTSAEFELKDAPTFMTEAETMSINGFNLNLSDRLTLALTSGMFNSREDSLRLDGLTLDCSRVMSRPEIMDQLLLGCIQKMSFKAGKFNSQDVQESFQEILSSALGVSSDKAAMTINSLDMKLNSGSYDLSADVKAQISGRVRSNGSMSYDPAAGKLTIKISEVKFGILSVTGKVFDELKKNESEKMKVSRPYVYYSIK